MQHLYFTLTQRLTKGERYQLRRGSGKLPHNLFQITIVGPLARQAPIESRERFTFIKKCAYVSFTFASFSGLRDTLQCLIPLSLRLVPLRLQKEKMNEIAVSLLFERFCLQYI